MESDPHGLLTPYNTMLKWAEDAGLNKTELAEKLGLSKGQLGNWKRRGLPSSKHALIAAIFGRSVDELIGRIPERGQDKVFDELMAFWNELAPRGKREILKHARYVRALEKADEPDDNNGYGARGAA